MSSILRLALKALLHNRLQALLTLSGMSVGIAMVIIVSGLGRGAQLRIESQIESAGPTLVTVKAGNFRPAAIVSSGQPDSGGGEVSQGLGDEEQLRAMGPTERAALLEARRQAASAPRQTRNRSPAWPLTHAELRLLTEDIDNIKAVAASLAENLTLDPQSDVPARIARVEGFQPAWPAMRGWRLLRGRLIRAEEHIRGEPVMLVSQTVAEALWPSDQALGRHLYMGGQAVRVVGVIDDGITGTNAFLVPTVYVPLPLAQRLLQRDTFDQIKVRSSSVATTTQVASDITAALRELRELPEDTVDDFRVETQSVAAMPSLGMDPRMARAVHSNVVQFEKASWEQMALSLRQAGRTFTLLLAGAAAVSLLVGGIGVMNIMLVSVTARTREIGLRMALGARMRDVMLQFLVEAVALAALGGLIGLGLGWLGLLVARHGFSWATAMSPLMLVLAVLMAALTGMLFGYGPARRAARLDPVVALKSE